MFGITYLTASDFAAFSYPRTPCTHEQAICVEVHTTPIEERYCPRPHARPCDDTEWDALLARGAKLFADADVEGCSSCADPGHVRYVSNVSANLCKCSAGPVRLAGTVPACNRTASPLKGNHERASEDHYNAPPVIATDEHQHGCDTPELSEDNEDCNAPARRFSTRILDYSSEKIHRRHSSVSSSSFRQTASKVSTNRRFLPYSRTPTASMSSSPLISTPARFPSPSPSLSSSSSSASSALPSRNSWKCPHCPWVQRTQRLPDFLRHQRSHFISHVDWPCPHPACGKSFARKDSLKRHLNNRATPCTRPPGYSVC